MTTEEVKRIEQLASLLRNEGSQTKLVTSEGEESIIPKEVKELWLTCLRSLLEGKAIEIVEFNQYMTTQQAANILGVSRPFLIKLLEQGEIPYTKVGTHRRIYLKDLMNYKEKRDKQREEALDELINMTEELGLYELDEKA
jgi:excisionase family DNA binding protein